MVNYAYGKIYKITSESSGLVYFGSTALYYLSKRLATHIQDYKRYLDGKRGYTTSFKLLERDDYKIQLIKNFPCANKTQLETEEAKYIKENECVNKYIPGRTDKEYREDNIEKIKEKDKKYYENNKEKINENRKEYYEINKDKFKQYNENNKSKINEQKSKSYQCSCGSIVRWGEKARHFKSIKHCQFINNL